MHVSRGEVFALLGHNGAGKTTFLKCILGLTRFQAGKILIDGRDARSRGARSVIGYLPESPYFYENLSAAELLDFYGKLLGLDRPMRRRRTAECLELVGMAGARNRRLAACSKGMRQRIGLAQALLAEPALLILDEPQSGLDPVGRRQVRDILLDQKRRGTTIVFSSHIVPDVEAVADRVAILSEGRLQEIKDLRQARNASGIRIVLARPPAGGAVARQLAAPGITTVTDDDQRLEVVASDPGQAGRLLTACHEDAVAVLDLGRNQGALEDQFLASLAGTGAVSREVVSC
jgi:ABC-2 type transport system ATP-binding protein